MISYIAEYFICIQFIRIANGKWRNIFVRFSDGNQGSEVAGLSSCMCGMWLRPRPFQYESLKAIFFKVVLNHLSMKPFIVNMLFL